MHACPPAYKQDYGACKTLGTRMHASYVYMYVPDKYACHAAMYLPTYFSLLTLAASARLLV